VYILERLHIVQCVIVIVIWQFYPGGGAVVSLPCTNLGSAAKRLKESDMVVTQPGKSFGRFFKNTNTTILRRF